MLSLLMVLVVVGLLVAVAAGAARFGAYPRRISYGAMTLEFSQLDRVCYALAVLAVAFGVGAGLILIWQPDAAAAVGKIAGTAGLVFLGSVLVLALNRLMRGRSG